MTTKDAVVEPVATAVVGFRQWHVKDGRLFSVQSFPRSGNGPPWPWPAGPCEWLPGSATAINPYRPLDARAALPSFDNSVGFYAYKRLRQAAPCCDIPCLEHADPRQWGDQPPLTWVVGAAVMWGRIAEYTEGYRAQYAKPIALMDHPRYPLAQEVHDDYGLPVLPAPDLLRYAGWWR